MSSDLYQRRRPPTEEELASIPWLALLTPSERQQIESELVVSDPQPGDYVCRVGRPATYWFGVVDGLLKMSIDTVKGEVIKQVPVGLMDAIIGALGLAGRAVPIALKRHPTARRLTMRLAPDGSEVRITLPRWAARARCAC